MYITAIISTLAAWFVGLLLDANLGDPHFPLLLRVLLPVLTMGLCLIEAIKKNDRNQDK